MPTYNLTSTQVPTPLAPTTPVLGGGTSGPFSTGMIAGVSHSLNQLSAQALLLGQVGAGGYGIVSGLALSASSGLNVAVGVGIALVDGLLELVASAPYGAQVLVPPPYTLADNATNYVWLTQTGALVAATTLSPPTNSRVFLGTVTTLSGAITNVDASGVVTVKGGRFARVTADIGPPGDTPPAIFLVTTTTTGEYLWTGPNHALQAQEGVSATIAATQTLTPSGPRTFYYKATAADETVKLPAPSALPPGWTVTVYNSPDSTHNVLVKDSAGATTYATATPGQAVQATTYPGTGGATAWPAATWTPATPVGGFGVGGASGAG
ncbi:MAG: hypothetical protein ACYC96_16285 [Fimbriimonadaceae bacterium]